MRGVVSFFQIWVLAGRIARRDLRGGVRGHTRTLGLLIAGVLVGVAAVALVGASSQTLRDGARRGALEAVGGDLSLRLFHRGPSADERAAIAREGQVSVSAELRPMVNIGAGTQMIELKGVDDSYPLYGQIVTAPQRPLAELLKNNGAVADGAVFDEWGLAPGDDLVLGDQTYQLRARLVGEPDRAFRAFSLGPRVMVGLDSLAATGLVPPGAEVYFYTRVKLAANIDGAAAMARIDRRFPYSGWRMVNAGDGVPGIERTLTMIQVMVLFLGLGVMLVGGAGISGAVRAHISAKMDLIAILKSIGAPPGVIVLALGFEVMVGAGLGAAVGVILGGFGPFFVVSALADQVPFVLDPWPSPKALVGAGLFGVLVAGLFAWWPLMGVAAVTSREVLRERFEHSPGRVGWGGVFGALMIVFGLAALVFWMSPMPILTGAFLAGGLGLAGFFYGLGRGLMALARGMSGRLKTRSGVSVLARLALGNLHRGGAPTGAVVMALGLTLTLLVALDGIERVVARHVATTLSATAPDLVLFSITKDRAETLTRALDNWDGLQSQRILPFLHARLGAINGVAVRDLDIPASLKWVVRGDRGVSFVADMPAGSVLTAGAWWEPQDQVLRLFSVDAGIAAKLGVGVGDRITLNVSGILVTGRIANLRKIDWTKLDLDFPILASPGALETVPHTYAATLKARPGRERDLENLITSQFGDLAKIQVDTVIEALSGVLAALVAGLRVATLMTGLAALVVLGGSILQGLSERRDEALLFKVLGAKRSQVLGHLAVEFAALGALVSLVAVPLGLSVAGAVAAAAGIENGSVANVSGALQWALVATLVTVAVGLLATLGAYTAAPSRYLRNRGV